jgi:hypothetical protein
VPRLRGGSVDEGELVDPEFADFVCFHRNRERTAPVTDNAVLYALLFFP